MTTYYVDNIAGGSNNGTSWTNAWESFADIDWDSISGGDTIEISGGATSQTYSETLTVTTDFSPNYVTVMASDDSGYDGTVIIDGGDSRVNAILGNGCDYVKFDGFTIQNTITPTSGGAIRVINANYVQILNCNVINDTDMGIQFDNVSNGLIQGNTVNTGSVNIALQIDGIYVANGDNNIIDGNTIINNNSNATEAHTDALQVLYEQDLIIRNNYIEGDADAWGQVLIAREMKTSLKIYNNVIVKGNDNNQNTCFLVSNSGDAEWTADIYIWNNTVENRSSSGSPAVVPAMKVDLPSGSKEYLKEIKNNIFIADVGYSLYLPTSPTDKSGIDYNLHYSNNPTYPVADANPRTWVAWQGLGFDANGLNEDPDLDADYRPNSGSPVIDAGVDLSGSFTTDKDGNTRPKGLAWDMGVYEYPGLLALILA